MDRQLVRQAALAAVLAGGFGLWVRTRGRGGKHLQADCSSVSESGGVIDGIRYLETTRNLSHPNAPAAMLVVFHSRGATPGGAASFPSIHGPVRVIRPQGFVGDGPYSWFSKSSSVDPTPMAQEQRQRAQQLTTFIAKLMRCRPTIGRPVVTGSSEGGHVSYLLASASPGLIGGAVALLGYIPPPMWNSRMARTTGLHTTGDKTIPYERTKAYWDAMKGAGAPLKTQVFPGGHAVDSAMGAWWRQDVQNYVDDALKGF